MLIGDFIAVLGDFRLQLIRKSLITEHRPIAVYSIIALLGGVCIFVQINHLAILVPIPMDALHAGECQPVSFLAAQEVQQLHSRVRMFCLSVYAEKGQVHSKRRTRASIRPLYPGIGHHRQGVFRITAGIPVVGGPGRVPVIKAIDPVPQLLQAGHVRNRQEVQFYQSLLI